MRKNESQTKNQHYVPQFLLKKFCKNENDQICVFDKFKKSSFVSNVRNVASENYFYDLKKESKKTSFENVFIELEQNASVVINKIIDSDSLKILNNEEKEWLAAFVITQKLRTKNARENIKAMDNSIRDRLLADNIDINNIKNYKPFESKDEIKEFSLLFLRNIGMYIPVILDKYWILFKSDQEFWISDNPIAMKNTTNKDNLRGTIGLDVYGIEIYMPISPSHVIGFYCKRMTEELFNEYYRNKEILDNRGQYELRNFVVSIKRKLPIMVKSETVVNFNSLQVLYSERFLFSSDNKFDLAIEMIEGNNRIKEGPRPMMM